MTYIYYKYTTIKTNLKIALCKTAAEFTKDTKFIMMLKLHVAVNYHLYSFRRKKWI